MSNYNYWKSEWDTVTSTDELFDSPDPQSGGSGGANTKKSRKVTITITNKIVGKYEARSYPHDDIDGNKLQELYEVDVYEILVDGIDDAGNPSTLKFQAPRFMPYYNNPKNPSSHYKTTGWTNAGLSSGRTITVSRYIPNYEVQNRYSPGKGAIVLTGSFYIHGGPSDISDYGFGSAGCVEIIGNYDSFKSKIQSLSGIVGNVDDAILELVKERNLIVKIEPAKVPNIKKCIYKGGEIMVRGIFLWGCIMLLTSKLYCQTLEIDTTAFKNELNIENARLYFDQVFNKQQLTQLLISENLYQFIGKDQLFTRINIDKDSIQYTICIIKAKNSKIKRPIIKSCYLETKSPTYSTYVHIGTNIIFCYAHLPMNLGDIEREDRKLTLYKLLLCTTRYCQKRG